MPCLKVVVEEENARARDRAKQASVRAKERERQEREIASESESERPMPCLKGTARRCEHKLFATSAKHRNHKSLAQALSMAALRVIDAASIMRSAGEVARAHLERQGSKITIQVIILDEHYVQSELSSRAARARQETARESLHQDLEANVALYRFARSSHRRFLFSSNVNILCWLLRCFQQERIQCYYRPSLPSIDSCHCIIIPSKRKNPKH